MYWHVVSRTQIFMAETHRKIPLYSAPWLNRYDNLASEAPTLFRSMLRVGEGGTWFRIIRLLRRSRKVQCIDASNMLCGRG